MTADERSCSMAETSKKLIQQVEKILDEGEGEERSVIVQMTSPDEKKKDLMVRTASEVIQKRYLTLTCRDLLPASLDQMRRGRAGKPTPAARRQLLTVEKSFSAQMAAIALPVLTKAIPTGGRAESTGASPRQPSGKGSGAESGRVVDLQKCRLKDEAGRFKEIAR